MLYKIKKNRHSSRPKRPILWFGSKTIHTKITFNKNCWYERKLLEHSGINKLYGFTFFLHGEKTFGKYKFFRKYVNSALIGWRASPKEGNILLYLYKDVKGVEERTTIPYIAIVGKSFDVTYIIKKRTIEIILDSESIYKASKPSILFGYYLKPYFGGKSIAPHNMEIEIERK